MSARCRFSSFLLFLCGCLPLMAQDSGKSSVRAVVVDSAKKPLEYVTVELKSLPSHQPVRTGATDRNGSVAFADVPFGDYLLSYGLLGSTTQSTLPFSLDGKQPSYDLGSLTLSPNVITLEQVQVAAKAETFQNSIDRKVYNVGRDIQSASGSASDLMQNIPSVQVDIDGNVSLRGSESVLILIDGKPSSLMGRNRAAVLEQLPADSIERIEVITNPSAKYKPDGTAGIINIVLKRKRTAGYSGSARATVGNEGRFGGTLSGNYNPGRYNIAGTYSVRRDYRSRTGSETRANLDETSGSFRTRDQNTREESRPLTHLGQLSVAYTVSEDTSVSGSIEMDRRTSERRSIQVNRLTDGTGLITQDFDRVRRMPESERDVEATARLQHEFGGTSGGLTAEIQVSDTLELENSAYTNVFRTPAVVPTFDNRLVETEDSSIESTLEFERPLAHLAKLEAGYGYEWNRIFINQESSLFDPALNRFVRDPSVSNQFRYASGIHSLYGTYGRPWGDFGALLGLRLEQTSLRTHQITTGARQRTQYLRVYPSLHLSYNLTPLTQLQLNYSRRVNRPDGDELNPYPQFQDPFNLRAGNPNLQPEDVHSIETGLHYKQDSTTYLASLYGRYRRDGITQVTRFIDATTQLTTEENLSTSRSAGLELAATRDFGERVSLNLSANAFRNEIDASNLGFSSERATIAWEGKISSSFQVTKTTLVQANANFTAKRLTPQGHRYPTAVANIGLRQELKGKNVSITLTLSDVFNSMKERTRIDTPTLRSEATRRRTSRIVYFGIIYNFGKSTKKGNDESLQFDETPM